MRGLDEGKEAWEAGGFGFRVFEKELLEEEGGCLVILDVGLCWAVFNGAQFIYKKYFAAASAHSACYVVEPNSSTTLHSPKFCARVGTSVWSYALTLNRHFTTWFRLSPIFLKDSVIIVFYVYCFSLMLKKDHIGTTWVSFKLVMLDRGCLWYPC